MSFQNLFSIKDKVALVTGGSRGIGEMIAAGFLANGAKVYISSRKADACDATAARLMGEVPDRFRNVVRHREEIVRCVRPTFARPRDADHGVDDEIRNVDALRAETARHALRKDSL